MAKDPYRYFRIEARELVVGLHQGVLELEKGAPAKEATAGLLRLAHTLRGAARVVKLVGVAELAHAIEDALAPFREGQRAVPHETVSGLLRLIDSINQRLASMDPAEVAAAPIQGAVSKEDAADTVRVEIQEVDLLLEGISETLVQANAAETETVALGHVHDLSRALVEHLASVRGDTAHEMAVELAAAIERVRERVSASVGQVGTELVQVRDAATRMRLIPAGSIFPSIELAARDAARSLDRAVEVITAGGEHRLDAQVLSLLRDALHHAVRNAVAHGIEPDAVRAASGKPLVGRIQITVERRGNKVAFVCEDDGRGFDVPGLVRAAIQRGVLSPSEAASIKDEDLFRLALRGGLTTARAVTEVSGRAVGLDVVRETAARLRGEVSLSTEAGRGARVEICVPVSLSSITALVVQAGDVSVAIPLDAVRRTMRARESEIVRSEAGDRFHDDERGAIPFLRLEPLLQPKPTGARAPEQWVVVVMEVAGAIASVGVDRLLGTASVVMRPLPESAQVDAIVAGVSLDKSGQPQMVLDASAVIAAARAARATSIAALPRVRPPILVIDDSLTTRMLEQSILESAGYEVELATSAEEALTKASTKTYCLFVVDVEMPGMSGFDFVKQTRADAVLGRIPAILVTSRNAEEDLRRGKEAGAHAYIVKGEFDQTYLLRTIRELVGS